MRDTKRAYRNDMPVTYLAAIGAIVVEFNTLELMMSEVLRLILKLGNADEAHKLASALYFTSKSNTGRIDMVKNAAPFVIGDADHRARLDRLCHRASALAGRRHDAVHALWMTGTKDDFTGVFRSVLPKKPAIPTPIEDLQKISDDCRELTVDLLELMDDMEFIHLAQFHPPAKR